MELSQKIRIFAPQFAVRSMTVQMLGKKLGNWDTQLLVVAKEVGGRVLNDSVLEEFANCRIDVEAVKRFTNLFGPLRNPGLADKFCFRLGDWAQDQWQFRITWDQVLGLSLREENLQQFPDHVKDSMRKNSKIIRKVEADGIFELTETSGMVYKAATLYDALLLKLFFLTERSKLRRCARPDCDYLPYFIAQHGKQQYCSEKCAAWGQQQSKKAWWVEYGEQWRINHTARAPSSRKQGRRKSKQKGEASDGSRKTR